MWQHNRSVGPGLGQANICGSIIEVQGQANTVEPVQDDTPKDQGNVSDCTGYWNTLVLFQLTEILWDQGNVSGCTGYQNTQVLSQLTEILWDHNILSDVTGCRKIQVSDCTSSIIHVYVEALYEVQVLASDRQIYVAACMI